MMSAPFVCCTSSRRRDGPSAHALQVRSEAIGDMLHGGVSGCINQDVRGVAVLNQCKAALSICASKRRRAFRMHKPTCRQPLSLTALRY